MDFSQLQPNPSESTDDTVMIRASAWTPEQQVARLLSLCEAQMESALSESDVAVEALDFAKTRGVDLVLTDVNMPRMDGITLVRELRALNTYKFTPMLVLTTESGQETKQRGKQAGATGWIVKPFNPEQLLNTIARVL